MNCSECKPHLEAYALGALDPYHRVRVEAHLQSCAECRHTLASFRKVVGELPHVLGNASPLRPPPSLKHQIMQAAQADLKAREQARAIQETFAPRAERVAPIARRGPWLLNPRLWMVSLASSIILIFVLLGTSYLSNLELQRARSSELAAQAQLNNLQQSQRELVALASSESKYELVLRAADGNSNAYGKVTLEANKPTVLFTAYHLPQLGLNEHYFLWTVNRGAIHLVGQFTPNQDGFAVVVFMADREDPVLKQVFVTRQLSSKLLPSNEHVLEWKASPNDSAEDFTNPSVARPTTVRPSE